MNVRTGVAVQGASGARVLSARKMHNIVVRDF